MARTTPFVVDIPGTGRGRSAHHHGHVVAQVATSDEGLVDRDHRSPVPAEVVEQIEQAGGPSPSDPWRTRDENSSQIAVPDSAADWIEAIANEETPEAP